jgi:hypothetical protein
MRTLVTVFCLAASFSSHAQMSESVSPLKTAFQSARAIGNIDLVLPVLRAATLYVVVGLERRDGERPDYFLNNSPKEGRLCVTVSESMDALARVSWPKQRVTGAQLLADLPAAIEILVVYPDGGDYFSREILAWYRRPK